MRKTAGWSRYAETLGRECANNHGAATARRRALMSKPAVKR
jgi:hypothetical protein